MISDRTGSGATPTQKPMPRPWLGRLLDFSDGRRYIELIYDHVFCELSAQIKLTS